MSEVSWKVEFAGYNLSAQTYVWACSWDDAIEEAEKFLREEHGIGIEWAVYQNAYEEEVQ